MSPFPYQSKHNSISISDSRAAAMANNANVLLSLLLICLPVLSLAGDPDMLQDLCVADFKSTIKVNGFVCKATVNETDFFFAGLANPGKVSNVTGSVVTPANVEQIPGLNTLGVSMARIDYAAGGLNPPHTHPRATEIVFVLEGTLSVGFITTANKLIAKTITKGQNFVFPRGLVHFQFNGGKTNASVIAAFNSQLAGTQVIATSLFGATPPVPDVVLSKGFQINTELVQYIKARFAS